jgi:hypothetical protein
MERKKIIKSTRIVNQIHPLNTKKAVHRLAEVTAVNYPFGIPVSALARMDWGVNPIP